jgi:glycosyltransferase involved in cell wall biosynthesis
MMVAVVSLHFSPAHVSHLLAFGKLLHLVGFEPVFILDDPYLRFFDFSTAAPAFSAQAYAANPNRIEFQAAIFYNAAVMNVLVARRMQAQGIRTLYVFHEPVPLRYRLAEGWKEILKLIVAKVCSIAMLRQSSAVLVASDYARSLYDRYYSKYNPNVHTFPLLFDDEAAHDTSLEDDGIRPFFSFLGYAVKAHDFDGFVAFAKYAIQAGSTVQFLIATRTDLTACLDRDKELSRFAEEGRIRIQHGRTLTNEEMNSYCAQSFCIWNVYKCSTQSGALVRAFMTGTPVIAARMGSFPEFIRPGVNGELVERSDGYDRILRSAEKIRLNIAAYSEGAHRSFNEMFLYRAQRDRLARILNERRKDTQKCA